MEAAAILIDWGRYLLSGISVTLGLVIIALAVGFLLGLSLALASVYGIRPLRAAAAIYVWFFRGLPVLVLLFMFYYGIFPALGLDLSAFATSAVVLGMRGAAYQSEIFRGSIQSISEGQLTAALSLGMTKNEALKAIILPQALRISLPSLSNEYPVILTDSAVCCAIGVLELLTRTSVIVSLTYVTLPVYIVCAGIFILMNYAGMHAISMVEEKFAVPGFGIRGGKS
jgi:polar amino acid transport system permease protein